MLLLDNFIQTSCKYSWFYIQCFVSLWVISSVKVFQYITQHSNHIWLQKYFIFKYRVCKGELLTDYVDADTNADVALPNYIRQELSDAFSSLFCLKRNTLRLTTSSDATRLRTERPTSVGVPFASADQSHRHVMLHLPCLSLARSVGIRTFLFLPQLKSPKVHLRSLSLIKFCVQILHQAGLF